MTASPSDKHVLVLGDGGDVERFRSVVAERLGLHFEDAKLAFLADVFRRRLAATERSSVAYLAGLEQEPAHEEIGALAQELTVGETYFFRNIEQYRALSEVVLPARMRGRLDSKRLQILSAGCASGEEAYSVAIVARETALDASWDISILAVDVNRAMLAKGARGRFSSWALRETPEETRRRWFRSDGRDAVLDEEIRASVRFEERNLADQNPDLWRPEGYDVVFCRNVVMYLTPASGQALVERITRALAPGGYLFLGHAETLRGLSHDFHLCHTHETFYYQRKERISHGSVRVPPAVAARSTSFPTALEGLVQGADSWVEAIRKASERIQVLADAPRAATASDAAAGARAVTPPWDLGVAFELLRKERFGEALQLIRSLPAESAQDADVVLLHAVLLTHGGQLGDAEEMCRRLVAIDELNAGAHYVLALCREGAGDRQGAVDHDQVAVYLDPGFAMPRLHLGLLARRGGDREYARRELQQALTLLDREEAARLLLFGGGFSREGLIALCRAEWLACGGRT